MNLRIATCLLLAAAFHAETTYAARPRVEPVCNAERFVPCSYLNMKRTIGRHRPILKMPIADFMNSKGDWSVTVGYEPAEKCAKITFYVETEAFSPSRHYERVFSRGGGSVSDSGAFYHKVGDVESGLRVHNGTCRVPAPEPPPEGRPDSQTQMTSADLKEKQALEEERERLELEEERERLALEEERERLVLEEERERIALKEEQKKREEERERRRLAEERRERERLRELARQRRLERERQRQRDLAIQHRIEKERRHKRALARQRQIERERRESEANQQFIQHLGGILGGIIRHRNQMRGIRRNTPSTPTYSRPTYTPFPSGPKCKSRELVCSRNDYECNRRKQNLPYCPE